MNRRNSRHEEEFFRLLVESAPDLVMVLDREGKVTFVSPSVRRLLGYEETELLGRDILHFIHPEDRERSASNLELAMKNPGVTQYSRQRVRHRDGTWRFHEASSLNLLDDPRVRGLVVNSRDITERMNLEKELKESRREMATLLANLPGMAYRCRNDPHWTMLFVSEGCRKITGYASGDLQENATVSYAELIHPEDRERLWREVQEALERKEPFQLVYRIHTATGEKKWVWEQGRGVFSEGGELLHLEGFITDITERVWAERTTRLQRDLAVAAASASRLEDFLDSAVRIIVQAGDIEFCALYLEEGEEGFKLVAEDGCPKEVILGAGSIGKDSPLARRMEGERLVHLPWEELCREAQFAVAGGWGSAAVLPLRWEGRTVGCILVVYERERVSPRVLEFVGSVTAQVDQAYARHRLLERLRESESRYRLLLEHAGEAIFSYDRSLRITGVNRRACEIIGYSPEELLGQDILDLRIVHPEDLDKVLRALGALLTGEEKHREEIRLLRGDGREVLVEITGAALWDREGRVVEIINVGRDVTERRRAEEELRQSEERYRVTFEATGTAMFHVDRKAVITDANREAEKLFGYSREEMVGRMRYMDLIMPGDVERVKDFSRKLLSGELSSPLQLEILARHRSGRPVPALITVAMLPGLEESVISLLNISDKKAYELELERRAAEMRDFLDIAAHELRHPATLLKGYAMTLKEHGERMDEARRTEALLAINKGADRLVGVVEELLEAARLGRNRLRLELGEVDPRALAQRAIEEMRARYPDREMRVRVDHSLKAVRADAERLLRLLVILLDNAVKYSPRGTPVEVVVEKEEEMALFSVLDRGKGVPEEDRERIFERFYQVGGVMHHAGPGLGLGLHIGKSIVEAHHGKIWYEPRLGGGSVFRFTIPLAP
ncbi:MAG: PAS domain S-box protein [Actinomycetota bacterium]